MSSKHRDRNKGKVKPTPSVPVREVKTFNLLPEETILDDDYLMYFEYIYIIDGVFTQIRDIVSCRVSHYKEMNKVKEVRRCNPFGHPGALMGDKCQ